MSISDHLRRFIRADKRSQAAIAAELGLSPASISKFMHGHRSFPGHSIDQACSVLGLRVVKAGN